MIIKIEYEFDLNPDNVGIDKDSLKDSRAIDELKDALCLFIKESCGYGDFELENYICDMMYDSDFTYVKSIKDNDEDD